MAEVKTQVYMCEQHTKVAEFVPILLGKEGAQRRITGYGFYDRSYLAAVSDDTRNGATITLTDCALCFYGGYVMGSFRQKKRNAKRHVLRQYAAALKIHADVKMKAMSSWTGHKIGDIR
ncbi:hypothetical protein Bbelb_181460 [Branchiostoma belcheri]|nr:hypothetical protein Bbelb_181460 [Branchiostoma belcheri]